MAATSTVVCHQAWYLPGRGTPRVVTTTQGTQQCCMRHGRRLSGGGAWGGGDGSSDGPESKSQRFTPAEEGGVGWTLTRGSWGGSFHWAPHPAACGPPLRSGRRTAASRQEVRSASLVCCAVQLARCPNLTPNPHKHAPTQRYPEHTEDPLTLSAAEADVTMVGRRSSCDERFRLGGPWPCMPEPRDSPRSYEEPRPSEGLRSSVGGWADGRLVGQAPAPAAGVGAGCGGGGDAPPPSAVLAMWSSSSRGAKSSRWGGLRRLPFHMHFGTAAQVAG